MNELVKGCVSTAGHMCVDIVLFVRGEATEEGTFGWSVQLQLGDIATRTDPKSETTPSGRKIHVAN
jgi:hypothetical protein